MQAALPKLDHFIKSGKREGDRSFTCELVWFCATPVSKRRELHLRRERATRFQPRWSRLSSSRVIRLSAGVRFRERLRSICVHWLHRGCAAASTSSGSSSSVLICGERVGPYFQSVWHWKNWSNWLTLSLFLSLLVKCDFPVSRS